MSLLDCGNDFSNTLEYSSRPVRIICDDRVHAFFCEIFHHVIVVDSPDVQLQPLLLCLGQKSGILQVVIGRMQRLRLNAGSILRHIQPAVRIEDSRSHARIQFFQGHKRRVVE